VKSGSWNSVAPASVPVKNWPINQPIRAGRDAGATDFSHYAYKIPSRLLRTAIVGQSLIQVFYNVVDVLDAHGQSDEVRRQS
jgi:hypothetical protein